MIFYLSSKHKHLCYKFHNWGIEKEGEVESEGEIGAEGHLGVAMAIDGEEDNPDDTPTEVREEESEEGDLRPGDEPHEEGDAEISTSDPLAFGEDDLDIEEWENQNRSENCVDDGDIEQGVIKWEEMREKGEWGSERVREEEGEKENTHGDEDLVWDLHEAEIIEDEDDCCECHQKEKTKPEPFVYFSEEEEMCVHEEYPGEEEKYPSRDLEEGIDGGYLLTAKPTLSSEENVWENWKEIEEWENVSTGWTTTPSRRDAPFLAVDTPNKYWCEAPKDGP